jgi:hypothetical protein
MHNYNNFHAQTESVAGPEKTSSHGIPNRAIKKKKGCAQGFLVFDTT